MQFLSLGYAHLTCVICPQRLLEEVYYCYNMTLIQMYTVEISFSHSPCFPAGCLDDSVFVIQHIPFSRL